MVKDAIQLIYSCRPNEDVDAEQVVVFGYDHHRISRPDDASSSQRPTLRGTEFLGGSGEVGDTSTDETPFHSRRPEENGFGTGRMLPQSSQATRHNLVNSIHHASV